MTASNVSVTDNAKQTWGTLVRTLADLGSTWAVHGLKIGKTALEHVADALAKTAHTLDTLAAELEKRATVEGTPAARG